MRAVVVLLFSLSVCVSPFNADAKTGTRVWPCYWVKGRMTVGSGTPATRIWPVGTHRILGVVSFLHPVPDDAYPPDIPSNVAEKQAATASDTIWGNFFVCPVTPERSGWMRFVVVRKAKGLFTGR